MAENHRLLVPLLASLCGLTALVAVHWQCRNAAIGRLRRHSDLPMLRSESWIERKNLVCHTRSHGIGISSSSPRANYPRAMSLPIRVTGITRPTCRGAGLPREFAGVYMPPQA